MKKTLKTEGLIGRGDLVKASGLTDGTIKYYSEIGLIPFKPVKSREHRLYPKEEALKAIEEIKALKEKYYPIEEIQKVLKGRK